MQNTHYIYLGVLWWVAKKQKWVVLTCLFFIGMNLKKLVMYKFKSVCGIIKN